MARRGKRISPERESMVHLAGFAVLVGLLIVISFLDISRLFSGGALLLSASTCCARSRGESELITRASETHGRQDWNRLKQ